MGRYLKFNKDFGRKGMIFLNIDIQSKSSIEETDDFSSDVSFSAFLVSEDALVGGEDEMSELSGGEDVVGPFFEVSQLDVVSGRDDSTFVDAANQFNDNFLASVIINDLKLSNVVVFLHDSQEFEQDFRDGSKEYLFFALSFSIDDGSECVCEDVDFDHFVDLIISNN